jgi:translation initiation factor IF-3
MQRVNESIRAKEVRVIGADGQQLGIMPIRKALAVAHDHDLDLVEVAPNADPPVCRLLDYGKYLYDRTKREKEARKAQKAREIKEIRLRPKTGEHDIAHKVRDARRFLEDGHKVKVRIRFRGREITHPEVAHELLDRIATDLENVGYVEREPRREGRTMLMILRPGSK